MEINNIDSSQQVGEITGDRVKGNLNEDLNEYTQKTRYSKYPIYTSDIRDIKLCGICIDRM